LGTKSEQKAIAKTWSRELEQGAGARIGSQELELEQWSWICRL